MTTQPGTGRVEPDQAAEQYRQREKQDQLAPVRGDQGGIAPRQDAQLGQAASRRRRGLGEGAFGFRDLPRQPDGHVLLVGRRPAEIPRPVTLGFVTERPVHLDPARFPEVAETIVGRSVERHLAAGHEHQDAVAFVQVFEVVGDHDDRPAVFGQLPHAVHDIFFELHVQAGGGLVEKQHGRLGQQLDRDADPLFLAPGQRGGLGVGGRLGLFFGGVHELQLINDLLHPVMPFLG